MIFSFEFSETQRRTIVFSLVDSLHEYLSQCRQITKLLSNDKILLAPDAFYEDSLALRDNVEGICRSIECLDVFYPNWMGLFMVDDLADLLYFADMVTSEGGADL